MTVLRHPTQVQLPADFGLGLAVTAFLAGLVLLACLAIASIPTEGPRGEARTPDTSTTYIDISGPAPADSPVASH
jgi:hypothetical protein